jgi:hypothetical protein
MTNGRTVVLHIPPEEAHFAAMGKVVANFAAFEAILQSAIWRFANVDDEAGICLTAELSLHRSFDALIALARLRGATDDMLKRLAKFAADTQNGIKAQRNRIVHDPVYFEPDSSAPNRLKISARKTVVYGYEPAPTAAIEKLVDNIGDRISKFERLIEEIANHCGVVLRLAKE